MKIHEEAVGGGKVADLPVCNIVRLHCVDDDLVADSMVWVIRVIKEAPGGYRSLGPTSDRTASDAEHVHDRFVDPEALVAVDALALEVFLADLFADIFLRDLR